MGIKIFGTFITVMVFVVIITALTIAGSPSAERGRRFDNQRVSDLRQIAAAVDLYYSKNKQLPASLNDLVKPEVARLYYIRSIKDPETSKAYEYLATRKASYQLCATFAYSNMEKNERDYSQNDKAWLHPAGYKCFELNSPPLKN